MSQIVLRGYKTSITNIKTLEELFRQLREKLMERAREECRHLLEQEIENLYDDISLDKTQRPDSIFTVAQNILKERIVQASLKQLPIEYNMNISANVLINEDFTFIKINSSNFIFKEVFDNFSELEEYSISDNDILYNSDTKSKRWQDIIKEYEDFSPMCISLLTGREDFHNGIKVEELSFSDVKSRLDILTRREMTSRLLNMYANYGQIPPLKLMEYMDNALLRLEHPDVFEEMSDIQMKIKPFITEITPELIK